MGEKWQSESDEGIEIDVQVSPEFAAIVSEEWLRAVGEAVLQHEGVSAGVTLVITTDEGIQELNRAYRDVDAPTDVLSFSAQEESGGFVAAPEASSYLGDVIVSYPRAVAQAEERGHPVAQELNLLIVHGILHLLGYDHAEEEEKAEMWARQDAILRGL
jgi:probable rRNA maturation factor